MTSYYKLAMKSGIVKALGSFGAGLKGSANAGPVSGGGGGDSPIA